MGEATTFSWLPVIIPVLPLVAAPAIYLAGLRSWKARNALSLIVAATCTFLVLLLYPAVSGGTIVEASFPRVVPPLGLSFRVDPLGLLLGVIASFIWTMATVYSLEYMKHEHHKKRYYPFLILALAGCLGTFMAGDLFTLFLFYEMMSLSAYVLVIHEETPEAMRAGYKYLIMTIIGGLSIFMGIAITYQVTGNISLGQGGVFPGASAVGLLGFVGFLIGFGIKAGMVPLHVWLPDAHPVAPSPASALLSGLLVKTGAYGLIRVIYDVYGIELVRQAGWNEVLIWLAAITIFLGSAVAIVQDDLKRRLAYSTIGQMGYILLGMALLTPNALAGTIFHIFSHAFMKSTLFLSAGAILHRIHTRSISKMGGVGPKMPLTMAAFTMASLAMIGVPPFNAFLSKWQISLGALDVGRPFFVGLLLVSSFMNMAYYMPVIIAAFCGLKDACPDTRIEEAPWTMLVPIIVLALANVFFNIIPRSLPLILSEMAAALLYR